MSGDPYSNNMKKVVCDKCGGIGEVFRKLTWEEACESPETALRFLIDAGIYGEDGQLLPQYRSIEE
jgi:hypothetical protein